MKSAPLFVTGPDRTVPAPVTVVDPAWVSGGPITSTRPLDTTTLPVPARPLPMAIDGGPPAKSIVALFTTFDG
jgi:hypothetical protein